jgi:hypothetical protein
MFTLLSIYLKLEVHTHDANTQTQVRKIYIDSGNFDLFWTYFIPLFVSVRLCGFYYNTRPLTVSVNIICPLNRYIFLVSLSASFSQERYF